MSKSKTAIYTMRRDGWRDYFELHVSPTAQAMRMHAEALFKSWGHPLPAAGWKETRGLVHPVEAISGPFVYMFVAEDGLGVGIVAHECLHVALAHERFVIRYGMDYGPQIGEDEERLAYYLTDTVKGVYNTLYDNGHIKGRAA